MKTVLVVGPCVPECLSKKNDILIVHKPCVILSPLNVDAKELTLKLTDSDGILFTSKNGVREFSLRVEKIPRLPLFCIGEETARSASTLFPAMKCIIAKEATQEGVLSSLLEYKKKHKLDSLFWPRSQNARPFLKRELAKAGIILFDIALYEPQILPQTYTFNSIDEIFFTCPSSVEAFFSLVKIEDIALIPLTPIGPITQKKLLQFTKELL